MTDKNKVDSKIFTSLIESIGNSFVGANDIIELKRVLEGLGFEYEGERKLGGDNKGIKYNKERCKKYTCKKNSKGEIVTHRCLGGIYIFCITDENDKKIILYCFTQFWKSRTTKNIPLVNENSKEKYMYVGKDINNLNTRISNHFGKSGGSTYALKLASEDITESEDKVPKLGKYNITCHRFILSDDLPEYARAGYIAMIEGILHEKLKPILGKK